MSNLQDELSGRWRDVLIKLGIAELLLDGNGRPCPMCGGTDRFQFSDKGRGMWYCRGCGHGGDGVKLALEYTGMEFVELARELERLAQVTPRHPAPLGNEERKRKEMARVWKESYPGGFIVEAYLRRRGYTGPIPRCLHEHPNLEYGEKQNGEWVSLGFYPAMVVQILSPDGKQAIGLHRTYLTAEGDKAPVSKPKKSLGSVAGGSAIRMHQPDIEVGATARFGLAEGIETGLAASQLFDIPVWATVSAGGMEDVILPPAFQDIWIFADHDHSRTGLKAASTLANRLIVREKRNAKILMPKCLNSDWADVLAGKVPNAYYEL